MKIETKLPKVGTTIFTVMSQLAASHDAVNLGQGFPDFDGPQALRDALTAAMNSGKNQYAPATGWPALRQQIARKCESLYRCRVDADTDVTVTSGATEALFAAIAAVVRRGDEVIMLDPCYDCYEPAVELNGGIAVHVGLNPDDFSVDWQRVRDAISPRTRLIIVNSPHNPSGAVFDPGDLDALAAITRDTDILVLSDEVYEHIVFDGREHQSVLRHEELAARSFVVSSFGKTYHCTGWKIGYCIAPRALSAELRKVHQYLTFCTFTPAQVALAEILEKQPEHYLQLPAFYQARREYFRELLASTRFRLLPVSGAYFQLVDYSEISDKDDFGFCEWLVANAGVAAIPVSAFYESPPPDMRLIRFCFAKSDEILRTAAQRMSAL
ncbi:pyridoxal phosphate-dependent aminotransferase [Dokdonella immobilis]|uniref:Succinyldiaminopimelate aminotransferase apoenzyme /2-keto-4-methylthiobutyrate aminotransferase apoenzyme n=1 Tax=Dokdonella immobilis TaxID=578942 RepID=A0A1I4VZ65_9GAMM|nr:pyridoxal phosphate-dependent aminotransferase [Dokdonella immobilis]SFN06465.1 succinyldiaminopimelate aminotransferase apoenzyme /2-keto-4-methylthiobutyrate aminotransferase apoenzyme [Dokdonella immobilis]